MDTRAAADIEDVLVPDILLDSLRPAEVAEIDRATDQLLMKLFIGERIVPVENTIGLICSRTALMKGCFQE
jgi:hypothetical protein